MGALNSLATLGLNLALSQRAQANESKELRQERDRQIQAIRLRDAEDGRQQEQALRRRLAEERARAGGAGVGSSGGSADAILAGLVAGEPPAQDQARRRESDLRIDDIRSSFRRPPQAQPARLRRPLGGAGQPFRRLVAVGAEPARLSAGDGSPEAGPRDPVAAPADRRRGPLAGLPFSHFVIAWNLQQGRETPDVHLRMARWLDERWAAGDRRLLLMVFRDAGKSTLVGLFCAWLLGQDPNLRLLVLSAEAGPRHQDDPQRAPRAGAQRRSPAISCPSGARSGRRGRSPSSASAAHRDPSLLARGIGANITGCRADIVICDDVEVPNTAGTQHKRLELRERLREASFVLVPDGTQLYIGTPHSYYSIYADEARPELDEAAPFLAELHADEHPADRRGAGGRVAGPVRAARPSTASSTTAAPTASAAR